MVASPEPAEPGPKAPKTLIIKGVGMACTGVFTLVLSKFKSKYDL